MADASTYRPLSAGELVLLKEQGCSVEHGAQIEVTDGFQAEFVYQTHFGGQVRLGALGGDTAVAGISSLIRNARIVDCQLGDQLRVENVGVVVKGYEIGDGAVLQDVGTIECLADAKFGNGVEVEVLNEGGGREVVLFDELSSQFAHMLCLYRYEPKLIECLQKMAAQSAEQAWTVRGQIGEGALVRSVSELRDVHVGARAVVCGAQSLVNGTILSAPDTPTRVGAGVQAHDFIIAEGACIDGGAMLAKSYVGQSTQVGRQFSAEGTLFFANCEAFHGEACSVFAGPYTVTHHKSSLLIAGMFSFYNAGSGTNQSNHMYKLGPLHEGRLERGSKTGSFSYMMWPCRVGPFSVVLGKHTRSFDTGDFPFSHIEAMPDGRCSLIPAFNMTTVGTVRDGAKWPKRDRRAGIKRDRLDFDVFSPFTVGRMLNGIAILKDLQQRTDRSVKTVVVKGAEIKRVFLRTGQKLFRRGALMYLAEKIVQRVERATAKGQSLGDALGGGATAVYDPTWVDVGGQLMPSSRLAELLDDIKDGAVATIDQYFQRLDEISAAYEEDEWVWVKTAYQQLVGEKLQPTAETLTAVADTLLTNRNEFLEAVLVDATKEFDQQSSVGFGTDGDGDAVERDFQAVRGQYDSNAFVVQLREEIAATAKRVEAFKAQIGAASE